MSLIVYFYLKFIILRKIYSLQVKSVLKWSNLNKVERVELKKVSFNLEIEVFSFCQDCKSLTSKKCLSFSTCIVDDPEVIL